MLKYVLVFMGLLNKSSQVTNKVVQVGAGDGNNTWHSTIHVLKKAPQSSGGEKIRLLGSLAYHRVGSNIKVLFRVHSHLPSIFSSPIRYKANETKDRVNRESYRRDLHYKRVYLFFLNYSVLFMLSVKNRNSLKLKEN